MRLARNPSPQYAPLSNAVWCRCKTRLGRHASRGGQENEEKMGRRMGRMPEIKGAPGLYSGFRSFPCLYNFSSLCAQYHITLTLFHYTISFFFPIPRSSISSSNPWKAIFITSLRLARGGLSREASCHTFSRKLWRACIIYMPMATSIAT